MNNIFIVDMSHDYYVEVGRKLAELGYCIKVIGASKAPDYWPKSLDAFISAVDPNVILMEDFNLPERFESIIKPDYTFLSLESLSELSYYEKMFLLTTDRFSFFPIPQIERCRLFYMYVGHFYRLIKEEKIDILLFFGTPHGLWPLALWGLAKLLKLKTIYVDWVALSPDLSTIETEIHIRRNYVPAAMDLGGVVNADENQRINRIVDKSINAKFVWTATKHISRPRVYGMILGRLIFRRPFGNYKSPEFFLNVGSRRRIGYVFPLIGYFRNVFKILDFYERNTTNEMPDRNSLVLFLAHQPEAATMPLGGVFADQLLVLDMILAALPSDMRVFVKEHPFMFGHDCDIGQDRHERSTKFYAHMLKDPRVKFVKRQVSSDILIEKAGIIASIGGSVSWEAMRVGKPCIAFGWAWYSRCKSCYFVDSVDKLRQAFNDARKKSPQIVLSDVEEFVSELKKRLIYAASCRAALHYLGEDYSYKKGVTNLANAINAALLQWQDMGKNIEEHGSHEPVQASFGDASTLEQ